MVDIDELKRLAEKATPGPWWVDSHGMNMSSVADGENFAAQIFAPKPYHEKAIRHDETGNLSHWRNDWDASFIAAANPAAVLELIATLQDYKRGAEVEARLGDEARAEVKHLRSEVEALRKGAARYEAVRKLDPRQFTELWTAGLRGDRLFDDGVDDLIAAMAAKEGE